MLKHSTATLISKEIGLFTRSTRLLKVICASTIRVYLEKLGFCETFASYLLLVPDCWSILHKGCPKRSSRTTSVILSTHPSAFRPCSMGPHFLWGKDSGPQTWPHLPTPAPSLTELARVRWYLKLPVSTCAVVLSLSAFPHLALQANIYSSFQTQLNSVLYEVFLTSLIPG